MLDSFFSFPSSGISSLKKKRLPHKIRRISVFRKLQLQELCCCNDIQELHCYNDIHAYGQSHSEGKVGAVLTIGSVLGVLASPGCCCDLGPLMAPGRGEDPQKMLQLSERDATAAETPWWRFTKEQREELDVCSC